MAYVEAHAGLRDHLKTKKVARLLGVPKVQVIGHMLCLWWWCQEYAQDGNLTSFDYDDIAEAAEWEGDSQEFVDALLRCGVKGGAGFLSLDCDGVLLVNDWYQYGGKLFVKRAQTAERTRNYRARNAAVTHGNADETHSDAGVTRHNGATVTHVTHIEEIRIDKNNTAPTATAEAVNNSPEVEPVKHKRTAKTKEPTPPTPVGEMFTRLCFILFGHTNTTNGGLTEKQRGLLNTESKRLRDAGATHDDLGDWYKQVWRATWPGNQSNQHPTVAQVVAGVNAWMIREKSPVNGVNTGDPKQVWVFNPGGDE